MTTTKNDVNDILLRVIKPEFAKLWWGLRLPAFGKQTPNEVWEKDPDKVLEYAKSYLDGSFS